MRDIDPIDSSLFLRCSDEEQLNAVVEFMESTTPLCGYRIESDPLTLLLEFKGSDTRSFFVRKFEEFADAINTQFGLHISGYLVELLGNDLYRYEFDEHGTLQRVNISWLAKYSIEQILMIQKYVERWFSDDPRLQQKGRVKMSSNNQKRDIRLELIDNNIATLGRIIPSMKACAQVSYLEQELGKTTQYWDTARDMGSGAFAADPTLIDVHEGIPSISINSIRVPAYDTQRLLQLYYDKMGMDVSQETVLRTVADAVAYYVATCLNSQGYASGVDLYDDSDYADTQSGISFELCKKIHALFPDKETAFVWVVQKDKFPYPKTEHRSAAAAKGIIHNTIPAYSMSELRELHIEPYGWSYTENERRVGKKRQYQFTLCIPQNGLWPTEERYTSPWVPAYVKADGLAMLFLSVWKKQHPESKEQ